VNDSLLNWYSPHALGNSLVIARLIHRGDIECHSVGRTFVFSSPQLQADSPSRALLCATGERSLCRVQATHGEAGLS
jgi:hypothetical protein